MANIQSDSQATAITHSGMPQMPVAGLLLGIIGVLISSWGAFGAVQLGVVATILLLITGDPLALTGMLRLTVLIHFGAPVLIGVLLVFISRRMSGRSVRRSVVDGVAAALLPIVLTILAVFLVPGVAALM